MTANPPLPHLGSYVLRGLCATLLITASHAYAADPGRFRPDGGLWWNPSASGHGYHIAPAGDQLAVVWYTHDSAHRPTWYLAAGPLQGAQWSASLDQYSWDGQHATGHSVGTLSIDFGNTREATISWSVSGSSGSETIEPFMFSTEALPGDDYTGLWYDPMQPGYGLTLVTQGNQEAAVLYFYDDSGNPRWALGSGSSVAGSVTLSMDTFSGPCPGCNAVPVVASSAGSITHTLSSKTSGTLATTVSLPSPLTGNWMVSGAGLSMLSSPVPVLQLPTTNERIKRTRIDMDNNGVFESVEEYSYDAQGRLTKVEHTYTDDGTPDAQLKVLIANSNAPDYANETVTYSYVSSGSLISLWQAKSVGFGERSIAYSYDSQGRVLRADHKGATSRFYSILSYAGDRLASYEQYGSNDAVFQTVTLQYAGTGLVDKLISAGDFGYDAEVLLTYDGSGDMTHFDVNDTANSTASTYLDSYFTRGTESRVTQWDFVFPLANATLRVTMEYDGAGRMTRHNYDLGADGSIDAVKIYEWESGPCTPGLRWEHMLTPSARIDPPSPYVNNTGYGIDGGCAGEYR